MYADDLTILMSGKNISTTNEIIQDTLNNLQNFAVRNGIIFSKTKSVAIVFNKSNINLNPALHIDNTKLKLVNEVKILGLTFDQKMLWNTHIAKLRTNCYQKLNILKSIAGKNWGADSTILRNTYLALIRSKMDYGSFIYGCARPLRKLDVVNNEAARIISGAFRSSPIHSLLAEANLLPLEIRRKQLVLNYASKIVRFPQHSNYQTILNNNNNMYKHSFSFKLHDHLNSIKSHIPKILCQDNHLIQPPWKLSAQSTVISPDLDILNEVRMYKPDADYITNLFQHKSNTTYHDHTFIFTDASISKNKVGCAALILNEVTIDRRIPDAFSVISAECLAILQALDIVKQREEELFVICSDSADALVALSLPYSNNPFINNIKEAVFDLQNSSPFPKIKFLWIPAHSGIEGNEMADISAKKAAKKRQCSNIPVYYKDLREHWSKLTLKNWHISWENLVDHKYTRHIKDNNGALSLTRKEQVLISRLKLGHTNISHLYLMINENPPICDVCNKRITVEHLITECIKYDNQRRKNNITEIEMINLGESVNIKKVLQFLKDTELYKKI